MRCKIVEYDKLKDSTYDVLVRVNKYFEPVLFALAQDAHSVIHKSEIKLIPTRASAARFLDGKARTVHHAPTIPK